MYLLSQVDRILVRLFAMAALGGAPALAVAAEMRIWVDVQGQFSVKAQVESLEDESVVLKRFDGRLVKVAIDQLSDQDKAYLQAHRQHLAASANPLRLKPPERPDYSPQAVYDLPAAEQQLPDYAPLELWAASAVALPASIPPRLTPDPPPQQVKIPAAHIRIFDIDAHLTCSRPILVAAEPSGSSLSSIGISVSSASTAARGAGRHQLVRFDLQSGQAYVSLDHDAPIKLLDHHLDSGRSLVLVGFDSLGHGGQLAIATGWGPAGVRLQQYRTLGPLTAEIRMSPPELVWARWIDEEHFVAVIDDTLGLWNVTSGRQLYRLSGIKPRTLPALSGGRRYLAVPYAGAVAIYESGTGKVLGVIPTGKQKPSVCFSPQSDRLAIVTPRELLCWDLAKAEMTTEIRSPTVLGSGQPLWVDEDLVLTSAGPLVSLFHGVPVWRYELLKAEVAPIGDRVAILHKRSASELTCQQLPHPAAREAIESLAPSGVRMDVSAWQLPGESRWTEEGWADESQQISAHPRRWR